MQFLILRFDAPLMAFGDMAVDELRPTRELPTLSMLTGLAANALGYRYPEGERLQSLQDRIVYGARLDARGELLRDFQTAQLAKSDLLWRTGPHGPSQRAGGPDSFSGPTLRQRHYRAGSLVTVALGLHPPQDEPTLETLARALQKPFRPLFMGRVSCPPAGPIYRGEQIEADNAHQALAFATAHPHADAGPLQAVWPADGPGGHLPDAAATGQVQTSYDRRDWINDLHAGHRRTVHGLIQPPRATPEATP
jgi:CRISPR system Cascade subunit CasD